MKYLTVILLFVTSTYLSAQTTAIPDANFEQALINLGYDTGVPDGVVPTSNIDTVTQLIVDNQNISDLTGIEDFTALIGLFCISNQLSNLNVTQNTALTTLYCGSNLITSLDVTQNTSLITLLCSDNQLTSLDVTQNTALITLFCNENQLISIDVTQNIALEDLRFFINQLINLDVTQNTNLINLVASLNQLTSLDVSQNSALLNLLCVGNQLTCLNVKNGNNIGISSFTATINPNLTCIEVDDVAYSTANWTIIDAGAFFSTNCNNACSTVGVNEEEQFSNLIFYPGMTTAGAEVPDGVYWGSMRGNDYSFTIFLVITSPLDSNYNK